MSMWTAIAIICVAGILGSAYQHRHERGSTKKADERLEALEKKLAALDDDLRERVEVLERIVTDRQENLKRQFDHLNKAS